MLDPVTDKGWEQKFFEVRSRLEEAKLDYEALIKEMTTALIHHGETSQKGERVTVTLVERGPKYKASEDTPEEFFKTTRVLDSDRVEKYEMSVGELPIGIELAEREKTVTPFFNKK